MPAAVVGSLRVLMSADSAQIVSDLGKARRAVGETRQDFALFGRAGVDAKKVFIERAHNSRASRLSSPQKAWTLLPQKLLTKAPTGLAFCMFWR